MSLILGFTTAAYDIVPVLYPDLLDELKESKSAKLILSDPPEAFGQFKSLETEQFESLVSTANNHRANGEIDLALEAYRNAMALPNIPMVDNAIPIVKIAESLIERGQLDRAYWLASIAADLRSDDPEFVNPFAEILIELCDLSQADDWLEGLGLDKNERSHRLLEHLDANRSQCAQL